MYVTIKDPDSRIDHMFDWASAYLNGNLIAQSSWLVAPVEAGGVAVAADSHDMLVTRATLTGGRIGQMYRVTNRVTLTGGQIDDRSITVRVEQR